MFRFQEIDRCLTTLLSGCDDYVALVRKHIPDSEDIAAGLEDKKMIAQLTALRERVRRADTSLGKVCSRKVFEEGAEAAREMYALIGKSERAMEKAGVGTSILNPPQARHKELAETMLKLSLACCKLVPYNICEWDFINGAAKAFIRDVDDAFEAGTTIRVEEFKSSLVSDPSKIMDRMAPLLLEYAHVLMAREWKKDGPVADAHRKMWFSMSRFIDAVTQIPCETMPEKETTALRAAIEAFRSA